MAAAPACGASSPQDAAPRRFQSFVVVQGESDLWIGWNRSPRETAEFGAALKSAAEDALGRLRRDLQNWGTDHGDFFTSLEPLPIPAEAPPVVAAMLKSGRDAGVGPMAAVAGAIAEMVGNELRARFGLREIVVENGGDLFIDVEETLSISVYAGLSSFSEKIAIQIDPELSPCGLACSSGTVGPSLSFGKADAAAVLAPSAAAADAWATALGNRIRTAEDLAAALPWVLAVENTLLPGPTGALAILGDRMAAMGAIRIAPCG